MEGLLGAPKLYSPKRPEVDFSEVRAAPIQLRGLAQLRSGLSEGCSASAQHSKPVGDGDVAGDQQIETDARRTPSKPMVP